jgi:hypothetical protein
MTIQEAYQAHKGKYVKVNNALHTQADSPISFIYGIVCGYCTTYNQLVIAITHKEGNHDLSLCDGCVVVTHLNHERSYSVALPSHVISEAVYNEETQIFE